MNIIVNTTGRELPRGEQFLVITRGLPASGKSTLARSLREGDPANRVIVEKDKLRAMFGGGFVKEYEPVVHKSSLNLVESHLRAGLTVIVSDTNLPNRTVKSYLEVAVRLDVDVWIEDLTDVSVEECHRRNRSRVSDHVPEEVIDTMYRKFIKGRPFPLPVPEIASGGTNQWEPYVTPDQCSPAVLVDIDGTLAHMQGRSPYDAGPALLTDAVDTPIRELVDTISFGYVRIILMSGRSEDGREYTEQWLRDNEVYYDELHMRKSGDMRKDDRVKYELFNEHVRNRYDVRFVLDDRAQVVKMWRSLGLKCLQVEPGDF